MIIFGVFGLLLISLALWIKDEKRQNIFFIIGGISLLVYSVGINDIVFILLQIIFILSAFIETIKLTRQ